MVSFDRSCQRQLADNIKTFSGIGIVTDNVSEGDILVDFQLTAQVKNLLQSLQISVNVT